MSSKSRSGRMMSIKEIIVLLLKNTEGVKIERKKKLWG
jgi:hypothetical protein